jgi:hypothetical protein
LIKLTRKLAQTGSIVERVPPGFVRAAHFFEAGRALCKGFIQRGGVNPVNKIPQTDDLDADVMAQAISSIQQRGTWLNKW